MPIDSIRLTDLDAPIFAPGIEKVRTEMADLASGCRFDPDVMRRQASEALGLADFGGHEYEVPFGVLCDSLESCDRLSPVGRVMVHAQLVQLLKSRLLLADLLTRHPEIREIPVRSPIFIAGLPRTGTTHLHNLISSDRALRSLPYWESLEPIPLPDEAGLEPDPRLARTELALGFVNAAMPEFVRMHEMTTWHVHEEIQLLAIDFSTMLFETSGLLPGWRDHYLASDQTPHYRTLRTILQALQFLRGGERWILKSPQHLEQFRALMEVFPDAVFVVTHRDPVAVVTSMATMAAYTARMNLDPVEPKAIGRYWDDRLERMLRSCVDDRERLPADRSLDVRFDEFMADDVAMVRRIYALAGQPFDDSTDRAMRDYMREHPRGRYGRVDYRPEDVGLDAAALRDRFAFYTERFLR